MLAALSRKLPPLAAAGFLVVGSWWIGEALSASSFGRQCGPEEATPALLAESRRLDEAIARSQAFGQELESLLERLRHGRVALAEASASLLEFARERHPGFLELLRRQPGATTDRENVARCLLAHLRTRVAIGVYPPETAAVADELERNARDRPAP